MPIIVPGIGYVGLGSTTPAAQAVYRKAMGGRSTGVRKAKRRSSGPTQRGGGVFGGRFRRSRAAISRARRTRAKVATRARGTRKSSRRSARLVKGSAAAKRYMAKIRKMRKR